MTGEYQRRQLFSLAAASALGACGSLPKNSPFWGTLAFGARKPQGPTITRAYAESLPYASMLGWFDNGPKALLVLAEYGTENRLTWYSAERESITTYGPFIVQVLGTEIELRNSVLGSGWSTDLRNSKHQTLERKLIFAARRDQVEVVTRSTIEAADVRTINILGVDHELRGFTEAVTAEGRPRYKNSYWIDDVTGRCWKSRQVIVPTMPHFNTEIVKYPQKA